MFTFCRFCAQEKKRGEFVADLQNVSEMYRRICPQYDSESSDQLPQRICAPCSNQLLNCWNFIEQIESAEKKLKEMIRNRSEKTLPVEEVIVCENSIIIFEPKIQLLKPSDMEKDTTEAELMNASDSEQSDKETGLMNQSDSEQSEQETEQMGESNIEQSNQMAEMLDELDTEHSSQEDVKQNNQGEQIDQEIKRQEYNLNRKRRRMKHVKFFSEIPRHMILANGTISDEAVLKLKQIYPEMKTISWQTCKYRCYSCNQVIKGTNQFFIHFQSEHFEELDSYRFICYVCDDGFETLFKLNRHIATEHFNHLRYRCNTCPEVYFWNLAVLDKHQKTHKQKFDCQLCNKTGLCKSSLAQHIRFSHLLKERPERFEKFICDICKSKLICDLISSINYL